MKDFGSIIKGLRSKNNLTQARLAELVDYSEKELQRIEQNKHIPSVSLLHQLSRVFNMDLNEYYKRHYSNLSLEADHYFNEINRILENLDYRALPGILKDCEKLDEFKQGENLILVMLGRALCAAHLDNDFIKSIHICVGALKTEWGNFHINQVHSQIFSNTSYAIINCLACNYIALNKTKTALMIYVGLINSIEKFLLGKDFPLYRSEDFHKRIYQLALYNVSELYFVQGNFIEAKRYSETGIQFSVSNNSLSILPNLYMLNMKSCYSLNEIQEAQTSLEYAYSLFGILGQYKNQERLYKRIKEYYPKLQIKRYNMNNG